MGGTFGSINAAVARRAFSAARIGALVWAVVFGATISSSALAYASAYPDALSRSQAAQATRGSRGLAVLLGPVAEIDTVGGYTVYKCFVFLTSIGALWGLLLATRLLRGEEDTGRWQLILAGGTQARRATAATLGGLAGALAVLFVGTTAITAIAGRDPDLGLGLGNTVLYGLSLTVAPAVFVAVGAMASQLVRSRRVASSVGVAVFALANGLRMLADTGPGTRWLLWATPFGWIERVRPYTQADWRPLGLAAVVVAGLALGAVWLAGRRDVGAGVLAAASESDVRPFGLGSVGALPVRREAAVLLAWLVGASVASCSFGMVAEVVSDALSPSSLDVLEQFGASGAVVDQYFGVVFLLVASVVALLPAGQIAAAAEEEGEGALALLLALPVGRAGLFARRLALAAVAIVITAALAGVAAWAGAATRHVHVGVGRMLTAGLNVAPSALVVLGIGAVVLAVAPRAAAPAMYAVVISSLVIDLLASLVDATRWLEKLSLFHYMALAPAHAVQPATVTVTLAAAGGLCALATILFARRDIGR